MAWRGEETGSYGTDLLEERRRLDESEQALERLGSQQLGQDEGGGEKKRRGDNNEV